MNEIEASTPRWSSADELRGITELPLDQRTAALIEAEEQLRQRLGSPGVAPANER